MTEGFESGGPELIAWPVMEGWSWVEIRDLRADIGGVLRISCRWWLSGGTRKQKRNRSVIFKGLGGHLPREVAQSAS